MIKSKKHPAYPQTFWWICALLMVSPLVSNGTISVAMILLVADSCILKMFNRKTRTPHPPHQRYFYLLPILFLIPLVTGIWSQHTGFWLERMQMKLPLFFLPLAFIGRPSFKEREFEKLLLVFLGAVFLGSCWSIYQYSLAVTRINLHYRSAGMMPAPMDYLFFGLAVCLAILGGVRIWLGTWFSRPLPRILLGLVLIWLIIYLHLLADRLALIDLYSCAVFGMGFYLVRSRRWWAALGFLILITISPVIAYSILPSFHNRVGYTEYDLRQLKDHRKVIGLSLNARMVAAKLALEISLEHPWAGVGFGDLEEAMNKKYDQLKGTRQEQVERILPSSEVLVYAAAGGWISALLLVGVFFYPLTFPDFWKEPFLPALMLLLWITMQVEPLLETQYGIFFYLFFLLIWVNQSPISGSHLSAPKPG
ncbi:MAG: hypothetical protein ACYCOO_00760 [Chitinophagaceae bacterium]